MIRKETNKPVLYSLAYFHIFTIGFQLLYHNFSNGAYVKAPQSPNGPTVKDDKLVVEKVYLKSPPGPAYN